MIGVDEAIARILDTASRRGPTPAGRCPLDRARGRVLRETVRADRDMPPFTRSAMDGYALRAHDTAAAPVTLEVIEEIPAGHTPRRAVTAGQASRIMTGGQMPDGADAVQMVEKTRLDGDRVVIEAPVTPGTHVRRAGEDLASGAVLIEEGVEIDAVAIALLASTGGCDPLVSRAPIAAILPTGDELVPARETPDGAKIRESNGHTIAALVQRAGGDPRIAPIVPDRLERLTQAVRGAIAGSDMVILSGGVSMGEYDLVGEALTAAGCAQHFHRVAIQPGKPIWFGTHEESGALVFGLPGNPVSTLVAFILFVRPALRSLAGCREPVDPLWTARLAEPVRRRAGRRGYLPARLEASPDGMLVRLVPSMGSADMVSLTRADALAVLHESRGEFAAGEPVPVLPLRGPAG